MNLSQRLFDFFAKVEDSSPAKSINLFIKVGVSIYLFLYALGNYVLIPDWVYLVTIVGYTSICFMLVIFWLVQNHLHEITRPVQGFISRNFKMIIIATVLIITCYGLYQWRSLQRLRETTVLDERDGQRYQIVTLDSLVWTRENLRYSDGSDGIWISDENVALYNWEQAKKACTGLGEGWRLPTKDELEWFAEYLTKNPDEITFSSLLDGEISPPENLLYRNENGIVWSGDESRDGYVWILYVYGREKKVDVIYHGGKEHGYSCRCVKTSKKI